MSPVDDEVMALGLAADGFIDGGVEKVIALRGAKRRPQVRRILLAHALALIHI